ncbi:MAG: hypothetical protein Q7S12_04100 [bacterium]|nr:hypothetical protein [bacterium]
MEVYLRNIHNSHGPVFTLDLIAEKGIRRDQITLETLKKLLAYTVSQGKDSEILYTYGIEISPHSLTLKLTSGGKRMAKVDYLWNFRREDQKFAVVVLEGDEKNDEHAAPFGYPCNLCGHEALGVNRQRMEIYDAETGSIKEVNVHDSCKLKHLKHLKLITDIAYS